MLLCLIEGLTLRYTDKQIAELMNSRDLLSPSGKPWAANAVKHALFKLRNYHAVPSKLHTALLQLCFDGAIRTEQAFILLAPRNPRLGVL